MVRCDWCISIPIVQARSFSHGGPLLYHSPVVFFDCGHPRFGNFNSIFPVDVIRVKSYVGSFLDPTGKPVRVLINKLSCSFGTYVFFQYEEDSILSFLFLGVLGLIFWWHFRDVICHSRSRKNE